MTTTRHVQAPVATISREQQEARNGHRGAVLLLTGLPGAGKSTQAAALHEYCFARGWRSMVLDGDALRAGLSADLGFSAADRQESLRRAGELAALLLAQGVVVILAMIAPQASHRALLAARLGADYHEIWCRASLAACEQRDPKGYYAEARAGRLTGFTGVSSPYEWPKAAHLELDCETQLPEQSLAALLAYLRRSGVLPAV